MPKEPPSPSHANARTEKHCAKFETDILRNNKGQRTTRGAAAGAAIGGIAGDAGKGAAIGATAGIIVGRKAKNYGDHKTQEQANTDAENTNEEMMSNFKKAFAAAMEGIYG